MANIKLNRLGHSCLFLFVLLHLQSYMGKGEVKLNYYSESCPKAEEIIKQEVDRISVKIGTTLPSYIRIIFHDCMVKSCDASLLLVSANGTESEQGTDRSFGLRDFKYFAEIKQAVERECPSTVSCADVVALAARDALAAMGGPYLEMKTGRRDSYESYATDVDEYIPNFNDSTSSVLTHFKSIGLDVEETVAILGAHTVGRTHCKILVERLYPTVDPTLDPEYAKYLKTRCPTPIADDQKYARNDHLNPYVFDNAYFKNLLAHKGLLKVDQQLDSDPRTSKYVQKFADDQDYFFDVFSRALLKLSENSPLTGDKGEIRKDCRYVNSNQLDEA